MSNHYLSRYFRLLQVFLNTLVCSWMLARIGFFKSRFCFVLSFLISSCSLLPQGTYATSTPTDQPLGVGIFGPVFIQNDTLALWGDLVLEHAQMQGAGVLTLIETKPQRVVSHQSRIDNLALLNPTRVTLHGNLVIEKTLTIDQQGVFDGQWAKLTLKGTSKSYFIYNKYLYVQ